MQTKRNEKRRRRTRVRRGILRTYFWGNGRAFSFENVIKKKDLERSFRRERERAREQERARESKREKEGGEKRARGFILRVNCARFEPKKKKKKGKNPLASSFIFPLLSLSLSLSLSREHTHARERRMLVKAIDSFESLFIPSGSAALRRDCSLAETEEYSATRRRLKTLACVPLFSFAYFSATMIARRNAEFIGNGVLCLLHAIILRQTANRVREQTISNSNHAEQACNLFAVLFWSKAYASLYSMGGEVFNKSRGEAVADTCALVLEAYALYVSTLAFRRLTMIYALYLVQSDDKDDVPMKKKSNTGAFEVDKHGNWHRLDATTVVDIEEERKEEKEEEEEEEEEEEMHRAQ